MSCVLVSGRCVKCDEWKVFKCDECGRYVKCDECGRYVKCDECMCLSEWEVCKV